MKITLKRTLLSACCFAAMSLPAAADTLIHAGKLIDGTGANPLTNLTIRIVDDRIVAVERGFTEPTSQ